MFMVLVDGGQPGRDVVVSADLYAGQDRADDVVAELLFGDPRGGGFLPGRLGVQGLDDLGVLRWARYGMRPD